MSNNNTSSDGSGNSYTEATHSEPSATTSQRPAQEGRQPIVAETKSYPAPGAVSGAGSEDDERKIEDVTDTNRHYEERMEDEYAKREGGA